MIAYYGKMTYAAVVLSGLKQNILTVSNFIIKSNQFYSFSGVYKDIISAILNKRWNTVISSQTFGQKFGIFGQQKLCLRHSFLRALP